MGETIENEAAGTPAKLTAVVLESLSPVMFIIVPGVPLNGKKEVKTGGGIKENPDLMAVPPDEVRTILPVDPPPKTTLI